MKDALMFLWLVGEIDVSQCLIAGCLSSSTLQLTNLKSDKIDKMRINNFSQWTRENAHDDKMFLYRIMINLYNHAVAMGGSPAPANADPGCYDDDARWVLRVSDRERNRYLEVTQPYVFYQIGRWTRLPFDPSNN